MKKKEGNVGIKISSMGFYIAALSLAVAYFLSHSVGYVLFWIGRITGVIGMIITFLTAFSGRR